MYTVLAIPTHTILEIFTLNNFNKIEPVHYVYFINA
jgi:hypothetical protein